MSALEIHSFHINVFNGDAAIHLLVDLGTVQDGGDQPKGIVKRAILVDGGKPTAASQIKKALSFVKKTYDVSKQENASGATDLAFDGIVVTRWAVDHSAGILSLIIAQLKADHPTAPTGVAKCSLFKYNGDTPATYFYAPYWNGVAASKIRKNKELSPTSNIKFHDGKPFAFDNDKRLVDFSQASNSWGQVCYLLASPRELIGREFFTGLAGTVPSTGTGPRWYGNVTDMIAGANAGDTGIFCIGADGVVPATKPGNSFTSLVPVPPQKGVPSIALIAVVGGNIQHYFAGDSDYQVDDNTASWIAGTVPVTKLSSHGSLVSWPHNYLDILQPQHFICSTGPSDEGFHPRWELLLLLNALVTKWLSSGSSPKDVTPFFHPTNYPMWFLEKDESSTATAQPAFNFDAFVKDTVDKDAQAFISILQDAQPNLSAYFRTTLADTSTSVAERTRFVIDYLRNLWVSMSYSSGTQHPVPGASSNGTIVSTQTQLLVVLAKLAKTSISISYINGAFKTVADSESPPTLVTDLDPGKGAPWPNTDQSYQPPPTTTARGKSLAAVSSAIYDVAPQGVKMPSGAKAINETTWQDQDDEVPSENYKSLIQEIYKIETIKDDPAISIFGITNKPTTWFVAQTAYPSLQLAPGETDMVILGDDDSMAAFVDSLVPGFIGYEKDKALDPQKDFWAWLMNADMIKTAITLTLDTTGKIIQGISMACSLFGSTDITFDTASAAAQFGALWPSDQSGCTISDTGVVLVGLSADTRDLTVSLSDVIKKFQMQSASTTPKSNLKKLLDAINADDKLDMKLLPTAPSGEAYRNAIWCSSSAGLYTFTLRLTWGVDPTKLDDVLGKVAGYLSKYLGIDSSKVQAVLDDQLKGIFLEAQITARYHPSTTGGYHIVTESSFTFSTTIKVENNPLEISIAVGNSGDLELYVKPDPGGGFGILSFVETLCGISDGSISNSVDNLPPDIPHGTADKFKLAYIWIARNDSLTTFGIGFVLDFNGNPIGLTYSSAGIYEGALITTDRLTSSEKLLPSYDVGKDASSLVDTTSPGVLITSLFNSGISSMPNGLPTRISQAAISYDRSDPTNKIISFVASLTRDPDDVVSNSVPAFEIDKVTFNAAKSGSEAATFSLSTDVKINPGGDSTLTPATLSATIQYKDGWLFKGSLQSFQLGLLFSHFPDGYQNAATDLLGNIDVESLDITYTYTDGGSASSFLITGAISFGELELRLYYQYTSNQVDQTKSAAAIVQASADEASTKDKNALGDKVVIGKDAFKDPNTKTAWTFYAYLGATADAQSATIGSILDSFDDGLSKYLPGFVSSTPVTPADPASGDVPVMIYMQETPDTGLIFVAHVHLGDVSLTFVQLSDKKDSAPSQSGSGGLPPVAPGSTQPKRIVRIGISKLPLVDQIPIVNKLPQPFDDLEYIWVTYPAPAAKAEDPEDRTLGFSVLEIASINDVLTAQNVPNILIKESTRKDPNSTGQPAPPDTGAKDVALAAGQHFVVIHGGKNVLDYNFSSVKPKDPKTLPPPTSLLHQHSSLVVRRDAPVTDDAEPDEPVKKGAIDSKPTDILKVQNVGLSFADGILWVHLDATVALGPISFSVLGFGVGFDIASLTGKGGLHFGTDSASTVVIDLLKSIRLELHGAAVSFNQPPLTLAGVFVHTNANGVDKYAGGIAVGIPPYLLLAVGEYDSIQGPPPYKSVFLFAKLDGPLVSLELATIEGVRLGFGYNSFVQPPSLEDLTSFPFINDNSLGAGASDPMTVLQNMQQYVMPQNGTFWGAIGMKITAFDLVSASAVALVEYSPKGLDVQIYVDAVLQMPPNPSGKENPVGLLYVEVVMIIELNFIEGFFRVAAALAPTSYIYVPLCHLTGSFALCYWFSPSAYSGDFVFTLGGYHASFTPPAYYPVAKRIGISFQLSDAVSVTGEAYFAICPKAVMGGGRLHIQFDIPLISAYFDAFLDVFIAFKPFHYIADMGVDVGVSFDFDCWIIHIHISAHIGANLHIEGPEFGGTAHVDLWIHSFDIPFGDHPGVPGPLLLDGDGGFYELVSKPGPGTASSQDQKDSDPTMNNLKISLEAGAFPDPNKKADSTVTVAGTPWRVRGGDFVFRVTTVFAIDHYTVNDDTNCDVKVAKKVGDPVALNNIFANPMWISDHSLIQSFLTVMVTPEVPTGVVGSAVSAAAQPLDLYKPLPVIKAVPAALWRAYDAANDPSKNPSGGDLTDGTKDAIVSLALGVSVSSPDPQLSFNTIPAFHAASAMSANVYPEVNGKVVNPALPDSAASQTSWSPAPVDGGNDQERWDNLQKEWKTAPGLVVPPKLVPGKLPPVAPKPSAVGKITANTQASVSVSELQYIVNECAGILGWSTDVTTGLQGVLPKKLLGSGFDGFYLALPQVAGAA